jgi:methyl acetate hydrolase
MSTLNQVIEDAVARQDLAFAVAMEGFDAEGKPQLRAPKVKATARHPATHPWGLICEFWNTGMPRCMEATGAPTILSGLKVAMNYPLLLEPGKRRDRGIGIDWLGRRVEKIDGRRIDQFCKPRFTDTYGPFERAACQQAAR